MLVAVVLVVLVALASTPARGLGFSANGCGASTNNALVLLFDDFSYPAFSKLVGAYDNDNQQQQQPRPFAQLADKAFCQLPASSSSSLVAAYASASSSSSSLLGLAQAASRPGVHVVRLPKPVDKLSPSETRLIDSAVAAARQQHGADFSVHFESQVAAGGGRRELAGGAVPVVVFTPLRMMPELFFGLFLAVSLSLTLAVFFCSCMDGIVTSTIKFPKAYPQKGKELN